MTQTHAPKISLLQIPFFKTVKLHLLQRFLAVVDGGVVKDEKIINMVIQIVVVYVTFYDDCCITIIVYHLNLQRL